MFLIRLTPDSHDNYLQYFTYLQKINQDTCFNSSDAPFLYVKLKPNYKQTHSKESGHWQTCLIELRDASLRHDLPKRHKRTKMPLFCLEVSLLTPLKKTMVSQSPCVYKTKWVSLSWLLCHLERTAFIVKIISKQYILGLCTRSVVLICHRVLISTTWISIWNTFRRFLLLYSASFRLGKNIT